MQTTYLDISNKGVAPVVYAKQGGSVKMKLSQYGGQKTISWKDNGDGTYSLIGT